MEKHTTLPDDHDHRLEHVVVAVTDKDSVEFAMRLEAVLNARTHEGFSVQQMIFRNDNQDLIVVFLRQVCVEAKPTQEGMSH